MGGTNSVNEAFLCGVPVLVIPQIFDQSLTAARVAEIGAGIHLLRQRATATAIHAGIQDLLANDAYRIQAKTIGGYATRSGWAGKGCGTKSCLLFAHHASASLPGQPYRDPA